MKKVISFILALVLVISSISSVLFTFASAEANLWTSISESDYVEPPSNKWAEFGGYADGVVTIKGTVSYQQFGFKMPKLEKNSDYQLSFGYNMGTAGDSIMLVRILTAAEFDAFGASGKGYLNTTDYGKTRQILGKTKASSSTAGSYVNTGAYSFNTGDATDFILFVQVDNYDNSKRFYLNDFNLIQNVSYNVSVDGGEATVNGNAISKTVAGSTVTVTATPNPDEAFERWEVVSGDITLADKNSFTTTFTMPENDVSVKAVYKENLWTSLVKADVVNCTSTNNFPNIYSAFKYGTVVINGINYQSFYIKMPALEANTTYKLSMSYSLTNDMSQGGMRILNKSQLDTMLASKNQYGDYTLPTAANSTANLFDSGNSGSNNACYFTTDSTTEYFVAIRCGNVTVGDTRITLSNIALTKVETHSITVSGGIANIARAQEGETITITAEPPLGKQFKFWEVVSGGVTLENPDAISTTFVMPKADVSVKAVFENSANLWDGLGDKHFNYLEKDSCTFEVSDGVVTIDKPWYKKISVELPQLEPNTVYRLSFEHKVKLNPSQEGAEKSIALIQLVNNDDFAIMRDDQANKNNGIIDLNSKGTTVAKNVATTGEWESVISYEFDSSNQTNYTLLFALNYVLEAEFRNFKLQKIATKIAPQFDANLGSVTPATELGQVGSSINFTAKPLKGNTFEGWYAADGTTLLSADMSFDYLVDDTFASPIAKFVSGTPAVENAGMENSSGKLVYFNDGAEVINDPLYKIQSNSPLSWQNLAVAENISHTGKKSLHVYAMYSFSGRTFDGLEKNTDYAISFWAYVDPTSDLSVASYVLPAGEDAVEGKSEVADSKALGKGNIITPSDEWLEVVIKFNSGENTAVTLWINPLGQSNKLWVDDFALFRPADLEVSADLGGTVYSGESGTLAKGTVVTVVATPNDGNTFKHWVDGNNNIVSTESELNVTVNEDMSLKAIFDGYNKPGYEVFAANGQDGTFENGSIKGWYATSRDNGSTQTWCSYKRSDDIAYEGKYSLKTYSMYQNSILPLTGLNTNTDYKLSFYVNYPEYEGMENEEHKDVDGNHLDSRMWPFGIVGADETEYSSKATIYAEHPYSIPCGGGWYKVELYFNTGSATAVNLSFTYSGYSKVGPVMYFDNFSLFQYLTVSEPTNTDFEAGVAPWIGATVNDGVLTLNETGATAYQSVNFGEQKKYTVSFRAKGKVFAGITDISAKTPSVMNALSSKSYVITESLEWKEYSFEFYTGIHPDSNLMFASMDSIAYVDDVVITESASPVGAVVEVVDFETERFALRDENKTAYEIYTANGTADKNVHSGSKSLHFKADAVSDAVAFLDEAYLGYGVIANSNYRLTLYVKTNDTVYVAPNRPAYFSTIYEITKYGAYCEEQGYEHSGSGWQKLQFTFTAEQTHVVKTVISNILGKTKGDFYIDDITVAVAPDPVIEADTEYLFCEEFFNIIPNAGFEKQVGTDSWVGLLENMQVKNNKSEADTGKYYLSLSKGEKYVMPISLEAGQVYYFAASVRGNGRVSLATMVEPTEVYFLDDNDNPASSVTSNSNKWSRSGFSFRANASGITYLVIEATSGALDVDTLSLCLDEFKYDYDPNRYEAPVKFDYDNIDPALLVYNGGFDENGNIIDTDSPATGDSATTAVLAIVITLLASATLVLFRKKEVKA